MAEKKRDEKKRVRNLFDGITGFPIMINLYVIKYIYYHIDKAECFIEKRKKGGKAKAYPIYGNWLPLSRQRFDRINNGNKFEISNREAAEICERFGIDIKYFRRDNPVAFEIQGIWDDDWKCFYNKKYTAHYKVKDINNETARAQHVETMLKALLSSKWEEHLDKNDPVYKVCYYFHYGKRSDEPDNKRLLMEVLWQIDFAEWENETLESLNYFSRLLKVHYDYINALITIEKLRDLK